MSKSNFKSTASRNLLATMVITLIAMAALLFLFRGPIVEIYFYQKITTTAIVLNGIIAALFLFGMFRLILLLMHYRREELAIGDFIQFLAQNKPGQSPEINPDSMIAHRYMSMSKSWREGVTPNHAALSQVMIAEESTRGNSPKFINNILILAGVFGTMVSLSIALFGTSSLLQTSSGDASRINLVVEGMSTALSTTITAIVCFAFFGFFLSRTLIAKTRILTAVESITTNYLMPRFKIKTDNVTEELAVLVNSLQEVVKNMLVAQNDQRGSEDAMRRAIIDHDNQMSEMTQQMNDIRQIMLRGFRLGE